jgi:nitrous oxidase accessory protein NosD
MTIRDTVDSGIYVCSTDGIKIRGNTIDHASQKSSFENGDCAMYLKNCVNGVVKNNAGLFRDQVFDQETCKVIDVD